MNFRVLLEYIIVVNRNIEDNTSSKQTVRLIAVGSVIRCVAIVLQVFTKRPVFLAFSLKVMAFVFTNVYEPEIISSIISIFR